jgi:hypothetical protein
MANYSNAKEVIHSKKDLHEALIRNGYRVPELKSKICTWQFLNDARL